MDFGDEASALSEKLTEAALQRHYAMRNGKESATHCDDCDDPIPLARQRAVPGVQHCIRCATIRETKGRHHVRR